ncbi:hypothetical protein EC973_008405 [Apophysomyces ossiformis]|uniref:Uncharacterized protein n=1 Tax=Apophysomyces ossiformis TaxID=679940 RepID=A0A8H7BQM5_9FUNG|nr:hypothetical protein EC973_008405 [Apophysomyces ossiformis]
MKRDEMYHTITNLQRERDALQSKLVRFLSLDLHLSKQNFLQDDRAKEIDGLRRENSQLAFKVESLNTTLKAETNQTRNIKEELSKAKNNMLYMKAQYAHEIRRFEQEHTRTRDRLYKLMNETHKSNIASLTMNDPLPDAVARISDDDRMAEDRALYTDLLNKSSDREKEARSESEEFRRSLVTVYSAVRGLLDRQSRALQQETARFRLPLDFGGAEAIKEMDDLLVRLEEEWNRQITNRKTFTEEDMEEKDQIIEGLQENIEELIDLLEESRKEYEEKTNIYTKFAKGNFFDTVVPHAHFDLSDSEDSVIDIENRTEPKLKRLRNEIKKEQRQLTEAALKLGDERKRLAADRWAFNEMKRELEMKKILSDTEQEEEEQVEPRERRVSFQPPPLRRDSSAVASRESERASKRSRSWLGRPPNLTHDILR